MKSRRRGREVLPCPEKEPCTRENECAICKKRRVKRTYNQTAKAKETRAQREARRLKSLEYSRTYAKKHPERIKEAQKKYCAAHSAERTAYARAWALKNPDAAAAIAKRHADKKLASQRARAGHTPEYFLRQLTLQGMCCAVCSKDFKSTQDLQADHCHRTGLPRGVLCARCNVDLGRIEHENFQRLLGYSDRWAAIHAEIRAKESEEE